MKIEEALLAFNALSQETRLRALRLLVKAGKSGMAAGALSKALKTPHNTMSFHLSQLSCAGIITSKKAGRSIIYSANFETVRDFISFIISDCCSEELASIEENNC